VWPESQIDYETFSHNGITYILYISYRSILILYILVATHEHLASNILCRILRLFPKVLNQSEGMLNEKLNYLTEELGYSFVPGSLPCISVL
jgi:hypothetical protein